MTVSFQMMHQFSKLGLGTIWFGQTWPPHNEGYRTPQASEVDDFLNRGISGLCEEGRRVFVDTAAAYGDGASEEALGSFMRDHPELRERCYVATKFGHETDEGLDLSVACLRRQFMRSKGSLCRIDLLQIHMIHRMPVEQCIATLKDKDLRTELEAYVSSGDVGALGLSVSNPVVLEIALDQGLLHKWCAVVQIPAWVATQHHSLVKRLHLSGRLVVVNSPVRCGGGRPAVECYKELLGRPEIHVTLTGTRGHLTETLEAAAASRMRVHAGIPRGWHLKVDVGQLIQDCGIPLLTPPASDAANGDRTHIVKQLQELVLKVVDANILLFKVISFSNIPFADVLTPEEIVAVYSMYSNTHSETKFEAVAEDNEGRKLEYTGGIKINYDPNLSNSTFRHSNRRQPLHTDASYLCPVTHVQFMICAQPCRRGGLTHFIDAERVAEIMAIVDPKLLDELERTQVRHAKPGQSRQLPILWPAFGTYFVNYNYYPFDKSQPKEVVALGERFFEFCNNVLFEGSMFDLEHVWQRADCVFWHDHLMLHGRSAFVGDRCLIKNGMRIYDKEIVEHLEATSKPC